LVAGNWIAKRLEEEKKEKKPFAVKWINSNHVMWGVIYLILGITCYFTYTDLTKIVEGLSITGILSFLAYSLIIIGAFAVIYGFSSWIRPGFVTAIALACYCGVIADHMLGNLIFIGMIDVVAPGLKDVPAIFMAVLPVSVIERTLFTAIGATIGVALLSTLRRTGLIYRKKQ